MSKPFPLLSLFPLNLCSADQQKATRTFMLRLSQSRILIGSLNVVNFQNVAMTSHVGKKSGLIPASSVTATTPAPGKATALSPSPYHGTFGGQTQNQEPPPPFLFVDSLKPIEIVVSFTAFSRWLDPPQPIVRERDKEKEKDSNSVVTGENE